ncbi:MAG TPA: restriction endonuclease subunit S [Anaerolineales bacterium]|nr:restriction endonuclease subunit S [Anaerolineales bacterium]
MNGFPHISIGELVTSGEAELKTGPFGTQLKASEYTEHGTPVINVRNIGMGGIKPDKLEYISDTTRNRLVSHVLHQGDIVFGRKGAVERHVFIRIEQDGWFQGSDCLRLRLNSRRIEPLFASYFFLSEDHQWWMMNQCSHGATMASLNQGILERIELPVPPLPIQKRITGILSAYDELIENNQRRIRILEEMARSLYREWFVYFRYPGHEDVPLVDSSLGPIPQGWEVKKLKDVCHLTMGQSPRSEFYNDSGDGLPFHQGVTDFGARFPSDRLYCSVENRLAEAGDILFSVRAPVGRMNIANKRIIMGRGLSAIRHKQGHQVFLWQQLKEKFHKEDLMGNGAIFASVTKSDMEGIELICPSHEITQLVSRHLEPMHEEIGCLSVEIDNLRSTRDLLLPKLLSGKIRMDEM